MAKLAWFTDVLPLRWRDENKEVPMLSSSVRNWINASSSTDGATKLNDFTSLATDVGLVRTTNQDRVAVLTVTSREANFVCACLCDGMGGMRDGDAAATEALVEFITHLIRLRNQPPRARLEDAAQAASLAVWQRLPGSGSTIAAVLTEKGVVYTLNVGDSRIYGFAHDSEIERLTVDDTLQERYGAENKGLLQYLGLKQPIKPSIQMLEREYEGVMLASDGCYQAGEDLLQTIHRHAPNVHSFAQRVIAISKWIGGTDNASLIYLGKPTMALIKSAHQEPFATIDTLKGQLLIDMSMGSISTSSPSNTGSQQRNFERSPRLDDDQGKLPTTNKGRTGSSATRESNAKPAVAKPVNPTERQKRPRTKKSAPSPIDSIEDPQLIIGFDSDGDSQ